MKHLKLYENYELITEDEDETDGTEYVPKKIVKWFRRMGVSDYLSAIQDLRDSGYEFTKRYDNNIEGS